MAMAAVCFFWGTTYLGIRIALEYFPPVVLVAARFLISGGFMIGFALLRGITLPQGRDLWLTARNGVFGLGVANFSLTLSETWIPSGLAALFVTAGPFWMVGIEAMLKDGEPLHLPTLAGMLVGFAGTVMLVLRTSPTSGGLDMNIVYGFLILQISCAAWAGGSLVQRRQGSPVHPAISGAVQQLAVGIVFAGPALFSGHPATMWTVKGWLSVLYLAIFGSIVAYSAYLIALDRLPVALTSMYTYVNPLVAVALGWLFYREPFGEREALAMIVIFFGVYLVKRFSRHSARA